MNRKTILFLAGNPGTQNSQLRLDQEVEAIREGLERSRKRDSFDLKQRWAIDSTRLRRAMMDEKPHIVHFCGHGTGENGIVLEGEGIYATQLASSNALGDLFRFASEDPESPLECVLLNACYTEEQAKVIVHHVNYVIGMNNTISDSAAIEFAVGFYDALGAGETIERSYEMGLIAIRLKNIPEDSVPVLRRKPNFSQSQQIIDEKTRDFVGREYIFKKISQFISDHPNGYFEIIADPGMGKSSILAKYVQHTDCISYFNIQGQCQTAEEFLNTISIQLIQRYRLTIRSLPSDSNQYASFFSQLLEESSRKNNGKSIVIAVDALDEVEEENRKTGFNILYLPIYLPSNVYVVITRRRGVDLPFMTHAPKQIFNLVDCQTESREDVCTYIKNRIMRNNELRRRQLQDINFIDIIADKSQDNFMYLVYVLNDIEQGGFLDLSLETFPKGLAAYYKWHWERMGMSSDPLPEAKLKTVYYLAAAREPITLGWLARRLPSVQPILIQKILTEWNQFLHQFLENGERKYSIYHASFRDFLYKQETLDGVKVNLDTVNDEIIGSLTMGLFDDE